MVVQHLSVGTDPVLVRTGIGESRIIFIIYNNSANTVYRLSSSSQGIDQGIPIRPNSPYSGECTDDLWLVADGLASDVRVEFQFVDKESKVVYGFSFS